MKQQFPKAVHLVSQQRRQRDIHSKGLRNMYAQSAARSCLDTNTDQGEVRNVFATDISGRLPGLYTSTESQPNSVQHSPIAFSQ